MTAIKCQGEGVKAANPSLASRPRSAEANANRTVMRSVSLLGGWPAPSPSPFSLGARSAEERTEGLSLSVVTDVPPVSEPFAAEAVHRREQAT